VVHRLAISVEKNNRKTLI